MHTGSQACCLLSAAVKASAAAHCVGHLTRAGTKSECFKTLKVSRELLGPQGTFS